MTDHHKRVFDEYLDMLRGKMREMRLAQIERQARINPGISARRIDELVLEEMTEKLERWADEADQKEEYAQRAFLDAVIANLPEIYRGGG